MKSIKYWNYRVIHFRHEYAHMPGVFEDLYVISEVHYDMSDNPIAYGEASPCSDDLAGVASVLDMMRQALSRPVLEASIFGGKND